jgi:L-threonylcarbamoyladenylate synthase
VAAQLADRFWPGPLTLVLPKSPDIVPAVTAGLNTVGLRVPAHPVALKLLREFGGAVAAPSANRSNRVSPTTAEHVREELGDAVDLVLDGGPCRVGIESTVLDLTTERPTILRPGGLSREQIEAVVGPVGVANGLASAEEPAASPGQHERHYAPHTPAYRYSGSLFTDTSGAAVLLVGARRRLRTIGDVSVLELPGTPEEYAQQFYAALRELDAMDRSAIYIQMPPDEPGWEAVRDRIRRATRPLAR